MTCKDITTKACSKCCEVKPFSEFYKQDGGKDGVRGKCKDCFNFYQTKRRKTKNGVLKKIYFCQCYTSVERNHPAPNYTRDEFIIWGMSKHEFHTIFDNWAASGYRTPLVPSADRLDDYKPYMLDNLQWVTWAENNLKYYVDVKNGVNNKLAKPTVQLDASGIYISYYHSICHADRITGINGNHIGECCRGNRKTSGGYIWLYAEDYLPTN